MPRTAGTAAFLRLLIKTYRFSTVLPPMLKISKLTDYGLLAAVYLARRPAAVVAAREIAEFYHLPIPMITKVLKTLQQGGLVQSHRGVGGGYSFDGDPEATTLGQLLDVLEGPWDLVECESTDDPRPPPSSHPRAAPARPPLLGINRAIKGAFE